MLCFIDDSNWAKTEQIDRVVFFYDLKSNLEIPSKTSSANFSSFKRLSNNSIPPQIKCGANYINSRMAFLESKRFGFDFPLLINENGFISESSGSCIFIIKNKILFTPHSSSHILDSITRKKIIELVNGDQETKIKEVKETQLTRFDILSAHEVFLVGTNIEIRPIVKIDNIRFNTEITNQIIRAFSKLVRDI